MLRGTKLVWAHCAMPLRASTASPERPEKRVIAECQHGRRKRTTARSDEISTPRFCAGFEQLARTLLGTLHITMQKFKGTFHVVRSLTCTGAMVRWVELGADMKINWVYGDEPGYWLSSEGRFSIAPAGYRHNTTHDYYELRDEMHFLRLRANSTRDIFEHIQRHYTVASAKAAAQRIIEKV